MNFEKYTVKSQEAIRDAYELAMQHRNPQFDQQHLLYAMLNQEESARSSGCRACPVQAIRPTRWRCRWR